MEKLWKKWNLLRTSAASSMNKEDLMQMLRHGLANQGSIPTVDEHTKLKTTVKQYLSQNIRYERQNSSTAWS
ncbi:unnamed protein product [Schistosoma margrebowiei]|uniref:Uncharacterized protein n=1 Tax=Schistosoma margrebowiei TaxID=48269 RepID=A0A183N985_9TREM|nr:unnamed protein product [Schistosoma margrebowiei]